MCDSRWIHLSFSSLFGGNARSLFCFHETVYRWPYVRYTLANLLFGIPRTAKHQVFLASPSNEQSINKWTRDIIRFVWNTMPKTLTESQNSSMVKTMDFGGGLQCSTVQYKSHDSFCLLLSAADTSPNWLQFLITCSLDGSLHCMSFIDQSLLLLGDCLPTSIVIVIVCVQSGGICPPNNNSVLWFLCRTQFSGAFKVCWYSPSWLVIVRWLDEWNDMWRGQQCERVEDDEDGRNREWMWTCYRWFNDNVDGVTGKLNVWRIRTSFLFYLLTDWVVGCFSGCFMSVYFYYASQPPPHVCVDRL